MHTTHETTPYIEVRGLKKYFSTKRGMLHAVDDVDLFIKRGETLGLVGESGCGKSTLGRCLIRLLEPTAGEVLVHAEDGKSADITGLGKAKMKEMRKKLQIVFQDPYASLNPRLPVWELIAEPLRVNSFCKSKEDMQKRIRYLMDVVGLAERLENTYPHELDGGRRQRIGVARALALEPEFIVLDEPVSALDVCIQAQILNLLHRLQKEFSYTYLFISHDLSVVKHVSDRIAVMYLGKIVETGEYRELFKKPLHPYTQALLSAIPVAKLHVAREQILLEGDVPSPVNPPPGCRFMPRCHYAQELCSRELPKLREHEPQHFVACHFTGNLQPKTK